MSCWLSRYGHSIFCWLSRYWHSPPAPSAIAGCGRRPSRAAFPSAQDALAAGQPAPNFSGEVFPKHFALPNFFFHVTMTYAMLRQGGVELGKMDYLGAP